jgi:HEAT repeat protein
MNDPDEAVRESVVEVLRGSEDPRAIALLLKARGDSSVIVREEALEALSELRSVSAPRIDEDGPGD